MKLSNTGCGVPDMLDPEQVRRFYNDYGEKEWERLDKSAYQRLVYHNHGEKRDAQGSVLQGELLHQGRMAGQLSMCYPEGRMGESIMLMPLASWLPIKLSNAVWRSKVCDSG